MVNPTKKELVELMSMTNTLAVKLRSNGYDNEALELFKFISGSICMRLRMLDDSEYLTTLKHLNDNMKVVNLEIAKSLAELGYDGKFIQSWAVRPNSEPEIEFYAHNEWAEFPQGTAIYDAPRLDDAAYFLREKYDIAIVIEPFIYNGAIYSYIARIIAPSLFDDEPEQMDGITIYNENGRDFPKYEDALEAALKAALDLQMCRKE